MAAIEKIRIDKYLWCIRIFKTRALAAEACDKGRVKIKGIAVKASKPVNTGDEFEIKSEDRKWVIKVTGIIHNRVAFTEAVKHYIDLTPEDANDELKFKSASFFTGKRLSKTGRPTKKQRRNMDDFM